MSQSLGNITISAAGDAIVTATASPTIADLTSAATGAVLVQATASISIDAITIAAQGAVIVSGDSAATMDDVALSAQATAVPIAPPATVSGGGLPWWWPEYVRNRLAEREARREALARYVDVRIILPEPLVEGEAAYRDPPIADMRAALPMPTAAARATHLHVVGIARFSEPITEEEAQVIAAATLLLAA